MPCLWIGHSDLGKESGMHLLLAQRSEDFQRCTDCSDVKQKKRNCIVHLPPLGNSFFSRPLDANRNRQWTEKACMRPRKKNEES